MYRAKSTFQRLTWTYWTTIRRRQVHLCAINNTLLLSRPIQSTSPTCALGGLRLFAGRRDQDDVQSFSDAHFGQERDREEHQHRQRQQDGESEDQTPGTYSEADHEHAVISTFDLFSIGIGPSSSHTVGPMRAGNIFITDLIEAGLLERVSKIRISLYGSLAATGEGHMTPSALLLGLEGADVETVDTSWVPKRFDEIRESKQLHLGRQTHENKDGLTIAFDYEKDLVWEWGKTLPLHSNGMRLTVFDKEGTMLATNDLFSVGGGFVVNGSLSTAASNTASPQGSTSLASLPVAPIPPDAISEIPPTGHPSDLTENMFYKEIRRSDAAGDRRTGPDVNPRLSLEEQKNLLEPGTTSSTNTIAELSKNDEEGALSRDASDKHPLFPFRDAQSLLTLCKKHNLTIAQLVYENERSLGYTDGEIREKVLRIWSVMDHCIKEGVQARPSTLPGSLKMNRRAPGLYGRLTRGLYPAHSRNDGYAQVGSSDVDSPTSDNGNSSTSLKSTVDGSTTSRSLSVGKRGPPRVHGSFQHPIMPSPPRRTSKYALRRGSNASHLSPAFPAIDYLTVYAMAVNEVNAAGGRVVTAPTNGAAGIIPAVLKYTLEFMSDDEDRDIFTFLLTAAAIGMLYKRGATISAAEGGCMAEVGVACSMAAGAFAACMGATPETVQQAAEIGIEHNLGLTCDPIGGLVQAPCIERNALGAIKAISSANLALSSSGTQKVSLDDAIRAMRLTAQGMRNEFKETSLSGLATSVSLHIPVSVPDC